MDADVIIVGAGPVGLMLAGELALAGVRPLVLDEQLARDLAGKVKLVKMNVVFPTRSPKKTCSNSARKSRTARTTDNSPRSSIGLAPRRQNMLRNSGKRLLVTECERTVRGRRPNSAADDG